MFDWTDIETSHRHREDLLREAATRRLIHSPTGPRLRRRLQTLLLTVYWETRRDLQRFSKLLRAEHERT